MRVTVFDDEWLVKVDFYGGFAMIHVPEVRAWTHGKLKQYRKQLSSFVKDIQLEGYSALHATPFANDRRALKLARLLGFKRIGERNGLVLMKINNA